MYTLHVKTDSTFDLYIDTEIASYGNLLEDMEPPIVPAKEIDDPDDVQPEDWVTEVRYIPIFAVILHACLYVPGKCYFDKSPCL